MWHDGMNGWGWGWGMGFGWMGILSWIVLILAVAALIKYLFAKPDALLLRSLFNGVQRPGAAVAMLPKGGNPALTEEDMQAVLAYIRQEFDPERRQRTGER